ncbi:hypothetical protein BH10ACI1_BH10ACI1_01380 [soil metagenome]
MNVEHWKKVKGLFDAVVELAPNEREHFLDKSCGTDKVLRREVEKLLISYDDSESFIEQPAAAEIASFIIESKNLEAGKSFGHYEIVKQIGAGGMGEVYLAKDNKLDRKVAVKILNEKFAEHESNLNRFIREAKAASALNHPNILVIHEIGESENSNYIVSEYIEGKTLREVIEASAMKLPEILEISTQIAGALVAAHSAKIVHRDIKPENIIVRPDGFVKILDFGLAKLVEQKSFIGLEDETAKQNETAQGLILGTVNYMSPDQAKGENIDARTDIFSFGVLLYEMNTGKTPFAGDSMSETFANLINAEPQPLARFSEAVPEELQRIISKTLRKNRDERYQTMKGLFADLKSLQKRLDFEYEFGISHPPETKAKTQILKSTKIDSASQTQNSIAVLPFANMSADAENEYFCDGLAEELLNALAKIKNLKVAARTSTFSFKNRNVNVSEIGNTLKVRTILEGSVRKSGDRLRISVKLINASDGYNLWSQRYDGEMKDIFDLQDEITLAVINELKVKFLSGEKSAALKRYTDNPKAYELYLKGVYYRWKLTPEEFRKCGDYFLRAVDTDPTFALGYFGLASYYGYGTAWGLLTIPPAEGWAKAEAAMEKVLELDATLPETFIKNAMKLVHYREWDEAGTGIERAAESNPTFPEIHHLYSFYLLAVGRFDESIAEGERALELDPLSLNYSRFLGVCFFFARRYDEAIEQLNMALELEPNNPSVHELLGGVFAQKGMFAEAVAAWHRAAMLEGDDKLAAIFNRAKDNFAEAVQSIAQKRIERLNAKTASGDFVLAINFARAYLLLGDDAQTFYWLEKAVEESNVFPLLMNSDPFYDRIRDDARFQNLLRRVGLPEIKNARGAATNETKTITDSTTQPQTSNLSLSGIPKNRKQIFIGGLMIFLLAAISFGYYFYYSKTSSSSAAVKKSLAVLPFVNAGKDENVEYLSDGITESIINNLSQLSGLRVMSSNSAFRFKNNQTDTKNIASQLGVETLVTGDIKQLGDKLIINVRLINGADDSQIWGNQYVKSSTDILAAQTEIAQAVAQNLRVRLTGTDQQQLAKRPTENAEAYQLYLRGRFQVFKLTPQEINKGISYFQQAIDLDPNYALAYAGISDAYRSLALGSELNPTENLPKSKAAAEKAIELDETLSEGYTSLGATDFWLWDWKAVESNYKRALELNPNSANAHLFYAHFLSNMGRHTEALNEVKLARELDPLFPFAGALEGQFLLHAGRADEALDRLQKTLELAPNFWMPHLFASSVYIEKGKYDEAIAEARKTAELSPAQTVSIAFEGYALAKSGRQEEARNLLDKLLKLSTERFIPPDHIAMIYNGLGETDKALEWLEKGYEQHDPKMAFLKVEPKWNNLRNEPRFINLMKRMNFE